MRSGCGKGGDGSTQQGSDPALRSRPVGRTARARLAHGGFVRNVCCNPSTVATTGRMLIPHPSPQASEAGADS
eukprot:1649454-Prymnesium_polylepis.1